MHMNILPDILPTSIKFLTFFDNGKTLHIVMKYIY